MEFDPKYFRSINFRREDVQRFLDGADRDINIAQESSQPVVEFSFSYSALFKAGQALIAAVGGMRVRSTKGHHVKVLDKLAEILNDESISQIGDRMRRKRNSDLYGGGIFITAKESRDYYNFVKGVINQVNLVFSKQQ